MSNGNEKIEKFLTEDLDEKAAAFARKLVANGRASWVWDPEYKGVAGLKDTDTNRIIMVLFLDQHDHEASSEWDDLYEAMLEGEES